MAAASHVELAALLLDAPEHELTRIQTGRLHMKGEKQPVYRICTSHFKTFSRSLPRGVKFKGCIRSTRRR